MKIGIVTWHRATNYGAVLQAFALQTFLQQTGHEPYFIDHHYGIEPKGVRKYVGRSPKDTLARWAGLKRQAVFDNFGRKFLVLSELPYCGENDLVEHPPAADAYICGSDQIWNPAFLKQAKDERAYWLDFGDRRVSRISYATSLGVASLSEDWSRRYSRHLTRFDHVSVREKDGAAIVAGLGCPDVAWVPDPTLLLPPDTYERRLSLACRGQNRIFSYFLGKEIPELAIQARLHACKCLSIPFNEAYERSSIRILLGRMPDPCQWLSWLKTSRFVVTNSFHAVIFSVLFRRPFVALAREGAAAGMNGRIESLLSALGLECRIMAQYDANRIEELCASPMDWDAVEQKTKAFSKIGAGFLANALCRVEVPERGKAREEGNSALRKEESHA